MIRRIVSLVAIAGAISLGLPTNAQTDSSLCYMELESGEVVNLGSLCGGSETASPPAPASVPATASPAAPSPQPQVLDYQEVLGAAGFYRWNSGEMKGIAFDVWVKRGGGGFYYFMWPGHYANVADHGDPDVVVFFDSNVAIVKSDWLEDCYGYGSSGSICANSEEKPSHLRYVGPCAFPWQLASNGSQCGGRAAMSRYGGF